MRITLNTVTAAHPAAPSAATALKALSLTIASGEQIAIIGPSGAGKTTLLHLLACALKPLAGTLQLDAQTPWLLATADLQRLRGRLFLAPQVPPLPPRQRVVTAVSAALLPQMSTWQALKNLFVAHHAASADRALKGFDLADKLFERVDRLSGGERQRVGLARCVLAAQAGQAQLLLVDEPLSALDPSRAQQAMITLTQVASQSGATLVCSLHQLDTALAHFPRIVGLRAGELVFDLPAAQVTPEALQALYGDAVHEWLEPHGGDSAPATSPAPAVMHCR